jgi:hypothetical protein
MPEPAAGPPVEPAAAPATEASADQVLIAESTAPMPEPAAGPPVEPAAAPATEASANQVLIAGASPQVLACLLIGVILFGVVVSAAYIATRRSAASPVAVAAAPKPALPPATPPPQRAPRPAPVVQPAPQPQSAAITADETRGKTFLQVGAIEASAAPKFIEGLTAKGFAPRIAEGPDPAIVRILIGPLSGDALAETTAKLTAAGVGSFPRTY